MKLTILLMATIFSSVAFPKNTVFIKNQATVSLLKQCQISFNDSYVETISLSTKQKTCLKSKRKKKSLAEADYFTDVLIDVTEMPKIGLSESDKKVYALAKKEFGLPAFLKKYPTYDGRQVITGVIDDGISPHHSGFKKTTTGERKYLAHFSHSSAYTFDLVENTETVINFEGKELKPNYIVAFDEKKFRGDYNGDGERTVLNFAVIVNDEGEFLCHDLDLNNNYEKKDCQRSFFHFGDYTSWASNRIVPLMAEIDLKNKTLKINEGEWRGDSHGEGVASVMAGHNLFGQFDGIAPGAQIVDYDLSEMSFLVNERAYTIGKFLTGIATLAESGAEVINMSYSFYFHSAASQKQMSRALNHLIEKYGVLLVFSAGNNGPGLGSMNRSLIYPRNSLVAGAFISKEMDALVHGATGVDEQGQIVYYSSRGPGGDFGMGPTVISPLASLTHSDAESSARSFSGTSSAAPALAGFSAVLISAIKQVGLPVDVGSVVSAIKLSGKKLQNTPFVFQGFGLPQIEEALTAYRNIIQGKISKLTLIGSTTSPRRDNMTAMGRLIRLQDAPDSEEFRISVYGEFNLENLNLEDRQALTIVDLEYSHDWLVGPERTWLTHDGGAAFSLTANYEQLDRNISEHFGEVRLVDRQTKQVLSVFPITVLNQPIFSDVIKKEITLSPEKADRIHFKAGEKTNGVQLSVDFTEASGGRVTYRLYNKDGVRIQSGSVSGGDNLDVGYALNPGETYQLAFSRYRGNQNLSFSVRLKPIILQSKTTVTTVDGSVLVQSNGRSKVKGYFGIRSLLEPIKSGYVQSLDNMSFKFSYEINKKGTYSASIKSPVIPDLTYFRVACYQSKRSSNTSEIEPSSGHIIVEEEELIDANITVDVQCFIFDLAPGVDLSQGFFYEVRQESLVDEVWSKVVTLSPLATTSISSRSLKFSVGDYELVFEPLHGGRINLGKLKIFPAVSGDE